MRASTQSPTPDPLGPCLAAATARDLARADALGEAALQQLSGRLAATPDDIPALVVAARVISQCRIPAAEMVRRGELSAQALEYLDRVVERDSTHWLARYMRAQHYLQAPPFMKREGAAARELDRLFALQGARTDLSEFARPYQLRSQLWKRQGQLDSARAVLQRGLRLFPQDSLLRAAYEPFAASSSPPPATSISAVVVRAARPMAPPAVGMTRQMQRMDVMLAPGAAADVFQAMQLQGGATLVGDGAELHARGGDPAESPLLLNGARLVGASRFESLDGALFAALDPQVLQSTQFSPGGFSARVGNALSGVIEVETEGRPRQAQRRFGLSSVTASTTERRPLGRRAGWWGSTRLSHTTPMLWMNDRLGEYTSAPRSGDLALGLGVEPDRRTELRATLMLSGDDVARDVARGDYTGAYRSNGQGGAFVVSARRAALHAPLIWRGAAAASLRRSRQAFGVLDRARTDRTLTTSADVTWQAVSSWRLRSGVDVAHFALDEDGRVPITPALAQDAPSRALAVRRDAAHVGVWTESVWDVGRAQLTTGLRADRLPLLAGVTLDPRVNLSLPTGRIQWHLAAGVFRQGAFRPTLDLSTPVQLADIPTRADHLVAGAERKGALDIRAEAFRKRYRDYRARGGPSLARGTVDGMELLVRRASMADRRVDGWITYAATRAVGTLTSGARAPLPFDVSHAGTAVITWRPTSAWRLGVTQRVATGRPFTAVIGADSLSGDLWQPRFGTLQGARYPSYARTDVRLTHLSVRGSRLAATFVEAINLLDRGNVSGWSYDARWQRREAVRPFFNRRTIVVGVELQ
ncbi:TonB-dependent receptor [Gemmatimonas groenlandica]|uniref:TonB-dependent receptor n=1 Tax=Gemmatimonas groenlandica TaxID=2732249 RepID=A0A6M4IZ20_9BACT|nr:TonB-dependent receptor [Gemmatimonas groenlandica]QJR37481.1 hypothetical protein HKW67_19165 [Gemmatimonas groenlandica]